MEAILSAILGVVNEKVYSSRTITIEKLEVVRAVRPRRYAHPISRPEVVVEDSGSRGKCCLCDERSAAEVFYWTNDVHCNRVWYCREHWTKYKAKQNWDGFRLLGKEVKTKTDEFMALGT